MVADTATTAPSCLHLAGSRPGLRTLIPPTVVVMDNVEQIDLREADGGVIVPVKAVPGSSRNKVVGVLGDSLKITTSTPPEKGKANTAITRILAKALSVGRKSVTLVSGPTSPRKEFVVKGISPDTIRKKLREM